MSTIHFEAKLFKIDSWTFLRLPKSASAKLPSRGMTMVEGTINGSRFQAALEPDGQGSHVCTEPSVSKNGVLLESDASGGSKTK
jgi:hypothetical protein